MIKVRDDKTNVGGCTLQVVDNDEENGLPFLLIWECECGANHVELAEGDNSEELVDYALKSCGAKAVEG